MKPDKEKLSDLISKTIPAKKESKRTTFKLSKQSLNAIDWIVETYNKSAKEVFNIIHDIYASDDFRKLLFDFAGNNENEEGQVIRERKTFVIDKHTLNQLNRISKNENIQRDVLVEKMVILYKALLEKHLEDEEKNEHKALEIISKFWAEAEKVESKLIKLLSDDNPIQSRYGTILIIIANLHSAIEAKLSEGTLIDPDDFSQTS